MSDGPSITSIILIALGIALYFLPNWIAIARKHHQGNAIFITNLLLGWTALGWIAALIWSFTAVQAPQEIELDADQEKQKQCPDCAEMVKQAARKCRYCGYEFNV